MRVEGVRNEVLYAVFLFVCFFIYSEMTKIKYSLSLTKNKLQILKRLKGFFILSDL